jgi:hypothetical protein
MQSTLEVVSTTDSKEDVSKAKAMYSKKPVETKPEPKEEKTPVAEKEAKASEALEAEITEPEEIEADDVDETEEGKENTTEVKPKKKGGFQKRIDKLTKEREAAKAEAALWREEVMNARQKAPAESPKIEAKTIPTEGRPDPEKFTNQAEFLEAVADWKFEQRIKAQEQTKKFEQAKAEQAKTADSFYKKVEEFKKSADDFMETLADVEHIPLTPALQDIFKESDHGPQLMYELAKEPEEYARISKLSPLAAAREMGKREARIPVLPSKETVETKTTKAPAPLKPVGKSATASTKDPGDMSFQEYKEWHKRTGGRTK